MQIPVNLLQVGSGARYDTDHVGSMTLELWSSCMGIRNYLPPTEKVGYGPRATGHIAADPRFWQPNSKFYVTGEIALLSDERWPMTDDRFEGIEVWRTRKGRRWIYGSLCSEAASMIDDITKLDGGWSARYSMEESTACHVTYV